MEYLSHLIQGCHSEYNKKEEIICEINIGTFFATFMFGEFCKCILLNIKYIIKFVLLKSEFIIFL